MKTLVALAGLTAGLPSPVALTLPAYAVGETCQGHPATLVGSPGPTVTGTDGPDVIVSNGSTRVNAGAGDDLICATGSVAPGNLSSLDVFGEAGNDVIDRRGDLDPAVVGFSFPGPGQDQVLGSPYTDYVNPVDGERDTIATGAGNDYVTLEVFGKAPLPEPDVVDLGPATTTSASARRSRPHSR